jgi:hypothetical protein
LAFLCAVCVTDRAETCVHVYACARPSRFKAIKGQRGEVDQRIDEIRNSMLPLPRVVVRRTG